MILFTLLLIIVALLLVFAFSTLIVGGTAFTIVFADVIVCIGFIVLLMKALLGKKKK